MANRHVHIISFNVPYPPDYGGVIDVYYKIKALHEAGVGVHLHCYQYGREETEVLADLCEEIHYYPRKKFYQAIYSSVPYIIGSRQSDDLLNNLGKDDYPIIFEGLHTCFYLSHPGLESRVKAVRMHNVEWEYYRSLGKAERNFFRRFYFYSEAKKLKAFEPELEKANHVLAISRKDFARLDEDLDNVTYIPAFHPNDKVIAKEGYGEYILYHGNLSVIENNQAVLYLLKKVYHGLEVPFIIAGKNPLSTLKREVKNYPSVKLIENPDAEKMAELIQNAHINMLPTFQATGIKLKLLNAIYQGRWCISNSRMVQNTGLEAVCSVENDSKKMRKLIEEYMDKRFEQEEIQRRSQLLGEQFSNQKNAEKLIGLLFPHPQ